MESFSANKAKTNFGELLLRVQRAPIQITRNGKEVAVVVSMEDYLELQPLKPQDAQNEDGIE